MIMNKLIQKESVLLILMLCAFLFVISWNQPAQSSRRYQYHVISVTGMTELRTQSDANQGRVTTIEKIVNEQAAQGWELYQADGYILYFRR
jgi:hypothetical protein